MTSRTDLARAGRQEQLRVSGLMDGSDWLEEDRTPYRDKLHKTSGLKKHGPTVACDTYPPLLTGPHSDSVQTEDVDYEPLEGVADLSLVV